MSSDMSKISTLVSVNLGLKSSESHPVQGNLTSKKNETYVYTGFLVSSNKISRLRPVLEVNGPTFSLWVLYVFREGKVLFFWKK